MADADAEAGPLEARRSPWRVRLGPSGPLALLAAGAIVFSLGWLSIVLAGPWGHMTPVWLPNAVWLTFLLRAPVRRWPAMLAVGAAGLAAASLVCGLRWGVVAATTAANLGEAAACALAVKRLLGGRIGVERPGELVAFGAIAVATSAAAAFVGALCLVKVDGPFLLANWLVWTCSDALGLVLFTPLLMAMRLSSLKPALETRMLRRWGVLLAAVAGAVVLSAVLPQHPLMLLTPPLLVLATLELEFAGAAAAMLAITAAFVFLVGVGRAPFLLAGHSAATQLLSLQAFLLMTSMVTFPVSASLKRRRDLETELKRSHDALAEANRQAKMAERLAGVGYWRIESSGRFHWSEQMYRIYGRDPAAGPPDLAESEAYVHPEDQNRLRAHREAFSDGEAPDLEVRIVRPNGEVRHVVARSLIERDAAGLVIERFGTCVDVTEVKLAEAAARSSEARYRFLADHAPDMISRTRLDGQFVHVSPGSQRVFGYTPAEMQQLKARDLVHPDDLDRAVCSIRKMITERRAQLDEPLRYRARHKSGEWIWIEVNPMLIFDETGEPAEFIDVVRNVTQTKAFETELKEARARAEAAAAAKSAFLANMSHELRTPLTSIIGFSQLLGEHQELTDEPRHFAKRISDASEALLAIINDVLDFSKLDAGQVTLERHPLSIAKLVDETTGLVAIQAAAKGLAIRTELDARTPPLIEGDVSRLRQVLLNFLSNAVKFTDRGSVTVRTTWRAGRAGGRLRLEVADTGAGIARSKVGRLFERFSQADVSINRTHGGTGLGLAICKGIVELMGGKIGVTTRAGEGSTFWFEIPAEPTAEVEAPAEEGPAVECPALRLLVVDDTAVNRELVKLMLAPLGLQVEEADGGAEGVKAAMTRPYDLILMDVRMPGVDGLEATRVIRAASELNRFTPILALTADVQSENAAACRDAGMNDMMAKPIVPQQLLAKIVQWGAGGSVDASRAEATGTEG